MTLNFEIIEVVNNGLCPQARYGLIFIALSINIPGISVLRVLKEGTNCVFADCAVISRSMDLNIREITVFFTLFIELVVNKAVIETHLEVCGEPIELPVSNAV